MTAVAFAAKALTAQDKLERGQKAYEAGDYDQAMNDFLDVFVEGNIEQISTANEYVNMIHFKRGGVSTPVRVTYDENLENQKEAYKQEAKDIQKEIEQGIDDTKAYTKEQLALAQDQIILTQEEKKAAFEQAQQDLLAQQEQQKSALLQDAQRINEEMQKAQEQTETIIAEEKAAITQAPQNLQADTQAALSEQEALAKQELLAHQEALAQQEALAKQELLAKQEALAAATAVPVVAVQPEVKTSKETEILVEEAAPAEVIVPEEKTYNLDTKENIIADSTSSMQNALVANLNKKEGVNVYFRNGKIDAIDIDSDVIFQDDNISFSNEGKEVLDEVYKIMLLSKEPTFVLLPPGSYTDEVNLQGVRQAVALNSYLINMGLSPAKLSFNMGLVNEQPPAKFSNLEGVSIVFDYDGTPNLYNKVSDKNSSPILSLGMYPEKINPSLNEGMVIDFSVIETSAPIAEWKLQIVQHASDGKYYVVRQVSGNKSIYEQIFWNGRKNFFGAVLPAGKYTLMLRAKDNKDREKIIRRKVEIVSTKQEQKLEESKTAKATKTVNKTSALDYTTPRLWTKPARFLKKQSAVQEETVEISEQVNTGETSSYTSSSSMTTTTTTTTQSKVVNPSATPAQEGLAYDPSLEELI